MLTIGLYGIPDPNDDFTVHDHAIAVTRGTEILTSIELERATGRKHDNRLSAWLERLIAPWLEPGEAVRLVLVNSFAGTRFATDSGSLVLETVREQVLSPRLLPCRIETAGGLWNRALEAWGISHELAHLGTLLPFYGEPQPGTLLTHIDGGASVSASSAWLAGKGGLKLLEASWPRLKLEANLFNANALSAAILGLQARDHLSMPGKLMGLAAHGRLDRRVWAWLEAHDWWHEREAANQASDPLRQIHRDLGARAPQGDPTTSPVSRAVARCMQERFERGVLEWLRCLIRKTGATRLGLSGGAALNVVLNAKLQRALDLEAVMIPPAPSDCGLALGAAAMAAWLHGEPIPRAEHAYLTNLRPETALDGASARAEYMGAREVARRIAAGSVVAVVYGRAELGPRALGHRSLLARPDSVGVRRRLSERLKRREWYRPVAPLMSPEVAREAIGERATRSALSRFMLAAWPLEANSRAPFAGCVHADDTVRAQVLDPALNEHEPLCELLAWLARDHGIHGVINTSLNRRGVPILGRTSDAIREARALGVDAVWTP